MTQSIDTRKARFYDALQAGIKLSKLKESGDQLAYESRLPGFILKYADIFKNTESNLKFDIDRLQLLESLTAILPDYFGAMFDGNGEVLPFYAH